MKELKNPADVAHTTEPPNNIEAIGLANLSMELTTTVNGETWNLKLELTKDENKVGDQMRNPTLVISITNNNLSEEIIKKIKEMTNPTNAKSRNNETKNPANVVNTREPNVTRDAKEMATAINAKETYNPRRVTKDDGKATFNTNQDR